ncbi:MAG: hypothetical protein WCY36_02400 [Candidatus Omnitrophota bacterium]
MRIIKAAAVLVFILVLIASAGVFYIDRIVTVVLEKKYDLGISYKGCSKNFSGEFTFKDLSVASNATGMGIFSGTAKIKPSLKDKKVLLDFALTDGKFLKKSAAGPVQYDTLTALVSAPFSSEWRYKKISGQVEPTDNGMKINNFEAVSDEIRLSLNGELFGNGDIRTKVVIYFASELTAKIPPEFAAMLLTSEQNGWKSLSVNLTGNPNKPAIQVSSKAFRLSIKAVEM